MGVLDFHSIYEMKISLAVHSKCYGFRSSVDIKPMSNDLVHVMP